MTGPMKTGFIRASPGNPRNAKWRSHCLKGAFLLLLAWMASMIAMHFFFRPSLQLKEIPEEINENISYVCTFPELDPFDPAIKRYIKKFNTLSCSKAVPNLVYLENGFLKVDHAKVKKLMQKKYNSFIGCQYKVIERMPDNDRIIKEVRTSPTFNDSIKVDEDVEHFMTECSKSGQKTPEIVSRSYFSVIRVRNETERVLEENYKMHITHHAPAETLSVLMIGIDGMSKQNFQRAMPKTRKFLLEDMQAIELHKYNKVGDNTFPNVMPLLTGKFWEEFINKSSNSSWTWDKPFDMINDAFLWSDYHNAGWRTGIVMDLTRVTAFHFEKKGWLKAPVDYYLRPTVIASEQDKIMKKYSHHCVGDIPAVTLFNDYLLQLASTFNNTKTKPYFGYSFAALLTHDDQNMASAGDELYYNYLKEFVDRQVLNNTLLVFFSDHGARFGGMRSTYNGVVEGRTPYIYFVFPDWFQLKYPQLIDVLKINQQRLATPFDVHQTLQDLLYLKTEPGQGDVTQRGISLFNEIPMDRTCQDIGIPSDYCVCNYLVTSKARISSNMAHVLALVVKEKVVEKTEMLRNKCAVLNLKSVKDVMEISSDPPSQDKKKYLITIITEPGEALYEATVTLVTATNKSEVEGAVTRLNLYRGQAECINDPRLRPFCYCKSEIKQ